MKILIAEDEPIISYNLSLYLSEYGCEPIGPLHSVSETISVLRVTAIDAVILDIRLRDGDAYSFASACHENGTPVLVTTGTVVDPSKLPPNQTVLPKPYGFAEVRRFLESVAAHGVKL